MKLKFLTLFLVGSIAFNVGGMQHSGGSGTQKTSQTSAGQITLGVIEGLLALAGLGITISAMITFFQKVSNSDLIKRSTKDPLARVGTAITDFLNSDEFESFKSNIQSSEFQTKIRDFLTDLSTLKGDDYIAKRIDLNQFMENKFDLALDKFSKTSSKYTKSDLAKAKEFTKDILFGTKDSKGVRKGGLLDSFIVETFEPGVRAIQVFEPLNIDEEVNKFSDNFLKSDKFEELVQNAAKGNDLTPPTVEDIKAVSTQVEESRSTAKSVVDGVTSMLEATVDTSRGVFEKLGVKDSASTRLRKIDSQLDKLVEKTSGGESILDTFSTLPSVTLGLQTELVAYNNSDANGRQVIEVQVKRALSGSLREHLVKYGIDSKVVDVLSDVLFESKIDNKTFIDSLLEKLINKDGKFEMVDNPSTAIKEVISERMESPEFQQKFAEQLKNQFGLRDKRGSDPISVQEAVQEVTFTESPEGQVLPEIAQDIFNQGDSATRDTLSKLRDKGLELYEATVDGDKYYVVNEKGTAFFSGDIVHGVYKVLPNEKVEPISDPIPITKSNSKKLGELKLQPDGGFTFNEVFKTGAIAKDIPIELPEQQQVAELAKKLQDTRFKDSSVDIKRYTDSNGEVYYSVQDGQAFYQVKNGEIEQVSSLPTSASNPRDLSLNLQPDRVEVNFDGRDFGRLPIPEEPIIDITAGDLWRN